MNKELLQKYADLKVQIAKLETQAEEIKPQIMEAMTEAGADKVESDFGSFSITSRKTWTYSPAVKEVEKTVKELKSKEEEDGIATFKEAKSLRFDALKDAVQKL